jgi:hypothetical protein
MAETTNQNATPTAEPFSQERHQLAGILAEIVSQADKGLSLLASEASRARAEGNEEVRSAYHAAIERFGTIQTAAESMPEILVG